MKKFSQIFASVLISLLVTVGLCPAPTVAQEEKPRILFDLTHAERISVGGKVSNVDTLGNPRIVPLDDEVVPFLDKSGFSVAALDSPPITLEKLKDYDILVIASPDIIEEGRPAYFSPDEILAIKEFVQGGGGLLLAGSVILSANFKVDLIDYAKNIFDYLIFRRPLLPDVKLVAESLKTRAYYPEVLNDLLKELEVGIKFNNDISSGTLANNMRGMGGFGEIIPIAGAAIIGPIMGMVSMLGPGPGSVAMSWGFKEDGDGTHPLWERVDTVFAVSNSLEVAEDAHVIARLGEGVFTVDMEELSQGGLQEALSKYLNQLGPPEDIIVKPLGSRPIILAEAKYGQGKIVVTTMFPLGWERRGAMAGVGPMFAIPMLGFQQLTLNMMNYLSEPSA